MAAWDSYSKWDKMELSDDSDVEVHPNVDKKSFIKWKQQDLHQKREQRKAEKQDLLYAQEMNTTLSDFISEVVAKVESATPSDVESILQGSLHSPLLDKPPVTPQSPTYRAMIESLYSQMKKKIGNSDDKCMLYIKELRGHLERLKEEGEKASAKYEQMQNEDSQKITSDDLHVGFDSSHIVKEKPKTLESYHTNKSKQKEKEKLQTIEVINNPGYAGKSSEIQAHKENGKQEKLDNKNDEEEEEEEEEEEHIEPSDLGREFGQIKAGDFAKAHEFISKHPEVVDERETDGLLIDAFRAAEQGELESSKQFVHQALLLQYCRALGRNGVGLFFQRITTLNHRANLIFYDDVKQTYERILLKAKEMREQEEMYEEIQELEYVGEEGEEGGEGEEEEKSHPITPEQNNPEN